MAGSCFYTPCASRTKSFRDEWTQRTGQETFNLYRAPKSANREEWKRNLPEGFRHFLFDNPKHMLCSLHFEEHFILKTNQYLINSDNLYCFPLVPWRLAPNAVPTIFEGTDYYSMKARGYYQPPPLDIKEISTNGHGHGQESSAGLISPMQIQIQMDINGNGEEGQQEVEAMAMAVTVEEVEVVNNKNSGDKAVIEEVEVMESSSIAVDIPDENKFLLQELGLHGLIGDGSEETVILITSADDQIIEEQCQDEATSVRVETEPESQPQPQEFSAQDQDQVQFDEELHANTNEEDSIVAVAAAMAMIDESTENSDTAAEAKATDAKIQNIVQDARPPKEGRNKKRKRKQSFWNEEIEVVDLVDDDGESPGKTKATAANPSVSTASSEYAISSTTTTCSEIVPIKKQKVSRSGGKRKTQIMENGNGSVSSSTTSEVKTRSPSQGSSEPELKFGVDISKVIHESEQLSPSLVPEGQSSKRPNPAVILYPDPIVRQFHRQKKQQSTGHRQGQGLAHPLAIEDESETITAEMMSRLIMPTQDWCVNTYPDTKLGPNSPLFVVSETILNSRHVEIIRKSITVHSDWYMMFTVLSTPLKRFQIALTANCTEDIQAIVTRFADLDICAGIPCDEAKKQWKNLRMLRKKVLLKTWSDNCYRSRNCPLLLVVPTLIPELESEEISSSKSPKNANGSRTQGICVKCKVLKDCVDFKGTSSELVKKYPLLFGDMKVEALEVNDDGDAEEVKIE